MIWRLRCTVNAEDQGLKCVENYRQRSQTFEALEGSEIYEKMLENREAAEAFVFMTEPPYANGDIHLGHALNKILKDVIVITAIWPVTRCRMCRARIRMACRLKLQFRSWGHNRKEMELSDFRKLCYDYALEQVDRQKKGFFITGCCRRLRSSVYHTDQGF